MARKSARSKRTKARRRPSRPGGSARAETRFQEALAHHRAGDLARAERAYRALLERYPDHAGALHQLAMIVAGAGNRGAAIDLLRRAVEADSRDAVARNNLGNLLREQGHLREAASAYRAALETRPDYEAALYNLGATLGRLGETAAAVAAFERLLELSPGDAGAWNRLGDARLDQGDPQSATEAHREALRIEPGNADAYNGLGLACMDRGEFAPAAVHFREAIRLDSAFTKAYANLAKTRRFAPSDREDIDRIAAALKRSGLSEADHADLHFALGKVLDDCGRFEEAFEHYARANRFKRREMAVDRDGFDAFVEQTVATFDKAFFAARRDFGTDSERPLFIVGMPRSGTTLVEQILASHPAVHGAGELAKLGAIARAIPSQLETSAAYPACITAIDAEGSRALAQEYLDELDARSTDAARVTDKMPRNYLHLGLVALLLPGARIVECTRDRRDVSLSIYFHQFSSPYPFGYDLRDIGFELACYERLMAHWRRVLPVEVHAVRYEALVADPEPVSRALIAHADLAWDPRCLAFHRSARPVHTASNWQVRQPLYRRAVERWRHYEPFLPASFKDPG